MGRGNVLGNFLNFVNLFREVWVFGYGRRGFRGFCRFEGGGND